MKHGCRRSKPFPYLSTKSGTDLLISIYEGNCVDSVVSPPVVPEATPENESLLRCIPFDLWSIPRSQILALSEASFNVFTTAIGTHDGAKNLSFLRKNNGRWPLWAVDKFESARGDTTKLLVQLQDGHKVETVVMIHAGHATACVSSQIGCKMGCRWASTSIGVASCTCMYNERHGGRFCATGTMGIIGDLSAGEIIEQLVHANSVAKIR